MLISSVLSNGLINLAFMTTFGGNESITFFYFSVSE